MAKRDPTAEAIARLSELKKTDDSAALAAGLAPLIADKAAYVVTRAADVAGERGARGVLPLIIEALDRLLQAPTTKDPGCHAKSALARAIVKLEAGYEAEDVLLIGARHQHWESVWGGSADLAVGLRGQCALGLAMIGSREALRAAVELLAEEDLKPPRERQSWPARADAARALGLIGSDGAAAVLRFKALTGDAEPTVLSDCLSGIIAIEKQAGLDLAEGFLTGSAGGRGEIDADSAAEAALLAVGGSRNAGAFPLLKKHADRFLDTRSRPAFLASVALTRQDAAIDYLLDLVANGTSRQVSEAAEKALEPLKIMPRVAERLEQAKKDRR